MKINFHFKSDVGLYRTSNQDAVKFVENQYGQFFGIVCDGLGGHNGGETASWMAVDIYVKLFQDTNFSRFSDDDINKWLRKATLCVKNEMIKYVQKYQQLQDMGTTVSIILISNYSAYLLNIGDSRIYKFENQKLNLLTIDHNIRNAILQSKTNINVERTLWKTLTSALGPSKKIKIDTFLISNIQDVTFLLTTDGVHDYLEEYEVIDILRSKTKLLQKSKEFIDLALNNVSTDNLTILIIEVK